MIAVSPGALNIKLGGTNSKAEGQAAEAVQIPASSLATSFTAEACGHQQDVTPTYRLVVPYLNNPAQPSHPNMPP